MTTIQPTVGRKVWYRPIGMRDHSKMAVKVTCGIVQPLDATIVAVCDDGTINVVIFDSLGKMHVRTSVDLLQEEEKKPSYRAESYCHWMPYQVGQAKAAEPQRPDAVKIMKPQSTDNKVTPEQITGLMARVVFKSNVEGTSTFVHAYLDGKFYLATGHSACVDPANFNAETGYTIARKNASLNAHNKLWELEGYALWKQMQDEAKQESKQYIFTTSQLETIIKDAQAKGFTGVYVENIPYNVADLKAELQRRIS